MEFITTMRTILVTGDSVKYDIRPKPDWMSDETHERR